MSIINGEKTLFNHLLPALSPLDHENFISKSCVLGPLTV